MLSDEMDEDIAQRFVGASTMIGQKGLKQFLGLPHDSRARFPVTCNKVTRDTESGELTCSREQEADKGWHFHCNINGAFRPDSVRKQLVSSIRAADGSIVSGPVRPVYRVVVNSETSYDAVLTLAQFQAIGLMIAMAHGDK